MASKAAEPIQPGGSVWWESGCLGTLAGPLKIPDGRGSMQKETPVTLVRHDPEMALSATPGRSALIVFLTFAKRA